MYGLLLIFLLLFLLLFVLYHSKGGDIAHELTGAVVNANEFKESDHKYYISQVFASFSPKIAIPGFITKRFEGEYDFITHDIRDKKIRRLRELCGPILGIKDLKRAIKKRDYDKVRYKEAKALLKNNKTLLKQSMLKQSMLKQNKESLKQAVLKEQDVLKEQEVPKPLIEKQDTSKQIALDVMCRYDLEVEFLNALVLRDNDPILYSPFYNQELIREEIMEEVDDIYTDVLEEIPNENMAKLKTIHEAKKRFPFCDQNLLENTLRDYIDLEEPIKAIHTLDKPITEIIDQSMIYKALVDPMDDNQVNKTPDDEIDVIG